MAGFRAVYALVSEARAALLLGVPSGRAPLLPLAEALARFESGLATAADGMAAWRVERVEDEWRACHDALDRAAAAAERLRLTEVPRGYEELAPLLDELLAPLESFDLADRRLRRA